MDEILKYFPRISPHKLSLLQTYRDRLLWWNDRINLISRQDTSHVAGRHILHSLAIAKCVQFPQGVRILDLGTGGGLPGIPLSIYFPDCTFTLIDGTGKKIKAVQNMIEELQLTNVKVIQARAEDFHGEYDFVVTRAVAELAELWKWAKPLIQANAEAKEIIEVQFGEGGVLRDKGLIALKGGDLKKEIERMPARMNFSTGGGKTGKDGKAGEAGKRIHVMPIHDFFSETYFLEKFIVFIPVSGTPTSSFD